MPDKKKKKKEIIEELQIEVKQLRAALSDSHNYADKLVSHIPYLPADIENLRKANEYFSLELEKLKKEEADAVDKLERAGVLMRSEGKTAALSEGILDLKKMLDSGIENFRVAFRTAEDFTLPEEFPGPYRCENKPPLYEIYSKTGDIVATTKHKDFSVFILNILNTVDKHLLNIDN